MKRKAFARVIITSVFALIAILSASAQSGPGSKSVGLRGGFTTRNTTASAGLYFSYQFTEHFRFAPKVDYAFRHKGVDAFSFNFDTEMPIALSPSGRVNFYPIAGLNYTTLTSHEGLQDIVAPMLLAEDSDTDISSDDSSQRVNRFGLNLGAGLEYFATPSLRLALEAKCQLIKQYTGGWFTISIGYMF